MKRIRILPAALILASLVGCSVSPGFISPLPSQGGEIHNVTIIEPGVSRRPNQTIIIENDTVAEIRDANVEEQRSPERYVIPGLIDMHVHQPLAFGGLENYFEILYLAHGVTSVRYTGYSTTGIKASELRQRISSGEMPGTRIFSCGPIIEGTPPLWPVSETLDEHRSAAALVTRIANEGANCIKVYGTLNLEQLSDIAKAAEQVELPVIGHVPTNIALELSGVQDVQHLIGVATNPTNEPLQNPMIAGWKTLSDERLQEIIDYSVTENIAHTPTLVFLWSNSERDKHQYLIENSDIDLIPNVFSETLWQPQESIRLGGLRSPEMQDAFRAAYKQALFTVGEMHKQGVRIYAGTDTGNPFIIQGAALIQELYLLNQAGLNPEAAIEAATTLPAATLGLEGLGTIQKGSPADLLVLGDDPTTNLDHLKNIETVIAQGRFYEHDYLQGEISRYQEHYSSFTWTKVLPVIAEIVN